MHPFQGTVILVGPMGAGKTTIGKLVASELSVPFIDTDREIEERCGADIPWIFDVEGEDGFRARESAVLADLSQIRGVVLATGGGIVMRPENRDCLRSHGMVVYLLTSIEQQIERTSKDRKRPLLQKGDPATVLRNLMAIRDPLYREVASHVVVTDGHGPRSVAREIVRLVTDSTT